MAAPAKIKSSAVEQAEAANFVMRLNDRLLPDANVVSLLVDSSEIDDSGSW